MTITRLTRTVRVITGKHDTVITTAFGRFTAENHEQGIREAKAFIAKHS